MKLNNKGFTLIEILAAVTLMGILAGIGVSSYSKYQDKVRNEAYEAMEKSAYAAAQNYLQSTGAVVPEGSTGRTIEVQTLVNGGFLDDLIDPRTKSTNCNTGSYVKVTKQASVGNKLEEYTYIVTIKCRNYTSSRTEGGTTLEGKLYKG